MARDLTPARARIVAHRDAPTGGIGARNGVCGYGWPHPEDPDNCEFDSLVEELVTLSSETHHEERSHMRQVLHTEGEVPSKWNLLRAHADPQSKHRDALAFGHGFMLKPLTKTDDNAAPAATEGK